MTETIAKLQARQGTTNSFLGPSLKALQPPGRSRIRLISAADFVNQEIEDAEYRVDRLWPSRGVVLLSAKAKTGKTTLLFDLLHSLLTGEPFLNEFTVTPVEGSIALLDLELTPGTAQRWLKRHGLDRSRLFLWQGRGEVRDLYEVLTNPRERKLFAAELKAAHVEVLALDPLSSLLAGSEIDENHNAEVNALIRGPVAALMSEAGIRELIVVHHAGHHSHRARGGSVLQDWPDALWTYTDQDGQRVLSARGRDVDVEGIPIRYTDDHRLEAMTSADRTTADPEPTLTDRILAAVKAQGLVTSRSAMHKLVTGRTIDINRTLDEMVAAGLLQEQRGRSKGYRLPEGDPTNADQPTNEDLALDSEETISTTPGPDNAVEEDDDGYYLYDLSPAEREAQNMLLATIYKRGRVSGKAVWNRWACVTETLARDARADLLDRGLIEIDWVPGRNTGYRITEKGIAACEQGRDDTGVDNR